MNYKINLLNYSYVGKWKQINFFNIIGKKKLSYCSFCNNFFNVI